MTGNLIRNTSSGNALNNEGRAVIAGNTFVDCEDQAIVENSGIAGTTITGNRFDNCSFAGEPALTVVESDAVISGNIFRNNAFGDISVANFSKPWLVGNIASYTSSANAESVIAGIDSVRFERHENDLITILPAGGNIGIGTDAPAALLHLKEGTDELRISGDLIFKSDSNPLTISAADDMSLDATQNMTVDAALSLDMGAGLNCNIDAASTIDLTAPTVRLNNELYVTGSSGVSINNPNNLGFQLAVSGNAAKTGGGLWSVYSDSRLKHSVQPLPSGTLDRLLKLKGRTFEYNNEALERGLALPGKQTGLIAQEVQQVFPEWVDKDIDGYLYVSQRGTTALFVEALRELRQEKDVEIQQLRNELNELSGRLNELEKVIHSVSAKD
jgi:hypothetical protein